MKKTVAMLVATALVAVTLAGCASNPTPTDVAKQALDAIKAQDFDKLQASYAGDASDLSLTEITGEATGVDLSSYSDEEKTIVAEMLKVMTEFDYKLGEETINGDAASVQATITTYDMGAALSDAISDYFSEVIDLALSGEELDESTVKMMFVERYSEKIAAQTEKSHVADTTLTLTKVDGEWKLDKFSTETVDAIMGGMITGVENLADNINEIADAA